MNKDCSKVSIERGSDGRFTVLLTGSKDDIRMLWTMLSVSVSKATKTPLPVLCAVCSTAGPAIENMMGRGNGTTVDMSVLGRFAKGRGDKRQRSWSMHFWKEKGRFDSALPHRGRRSCPLPGVLLTSRDALSLSRPRQSFDIRRAPGRGQDKKVRKDDPP